jgi:hypothetical protein
VLGPEHVFRAADRQLLDRVGVGLAFVISAAGVALGMDVVQAWVHGLLDCRTDHVGRRDQVQHLVLRA